MGKRSKKRLLLIIFISAVPLYFLYQECLLRNSYHLELAKPHKHPFMFYSGTIVDRNKSRVREWIRNDFNATEYLAESSYVLKQMTMLMRFGENEDFALMWELAEKGFQTSHPHWKHRREGYSRFLSKWISNYYVENGEAGISQLHDELRTRNIDSEVRKGFEIYLRRLESAEDAKSDLTH